MPVRHGAMRLRARRRGGTCVSSCRRDATPTACACNCVTRRTTDTLRAVIPSRHHRLRLAVRALLLALLVSCTIVQPVLAAWNEAHELGAHVAPDGDSHEDGHEGDDERRTSTSTRPGSQQTAPSTPSDLANDDEDATPRHQLAHLHAQCCSQPQLPPPDGLRLPPPAPPASGPRMAARTHAPDTRLTSPFRPPIGI